MENQDKYPWLSWSDRFSIRVQTFAVKHVFSAVLMAVTVLLVGLVFGYAYPLRLHVSGDPVSNQGKVAYASKKQEARFGY